MNEGETVSRETLRMSGFSGEALRRLETYVDLLIAWTQKINLVGPSNSAEIWHRHVADSLQLLPFVSNHDRAIDLGSGGGLPGLVLAIATGTHFHLIEADTRKAAFLREAARETQAPVTVHACRIERRPCAPARLITSRALAPLGKLLALAAPLLEPGGEMLFLKGRKVEQEIEQARTRWTMNLTRTTSTLEPEGVILRISEVAGVP